MTTLTKIQGNRIDTEDVASKIMQTSEFTTELNKKQDVITDLADIRSGAAKGETALQSYTETDPTVPSYVKNITEENITAWTNKSDFSGSYNDLTDKPTIPDVSNFITKDVDNLTNYTLTSGLSTVAISGSYEDLSNKPTIPTVNNNTITLKQGDTVKGTFTLNQNEDATITLDEGGSGSSSWGNITGTLSDQTDLQTALDNKQNKLTAGTNITISDDNVISATGGGFSDISKSVENLNTSGTTPLKLWEGTETQWNAGKTTDWYNWKTESALGEWVQTSLPSSQRWDSVAYGNGKYVAFSYGTEGCYSAYSTDGINWTQGTTLEYSLTSAKIQYCYDKFIVIIQATTRANIYYSTDGINWTQTTMPSSQQWQSIAYGNGKFVAVAGSSSNTDVYAYSDDGITWTQGTLPSSQYWRDLVFGNGKFVVIAYNSDVFAYSTDGINWTRGTMSSSQQWYLVTYGNGKFVTISYDNNGSNIFAYSVDGINWTQSTLPSTQRWFSIAYGNGKFVASGFIYNTSNVYICSSDGINWIQRDMTSLSSNLFYLTYGDNKFIAVFYNSSSSAYLPITSGLSSYTDTETPTISSKVYDSPNTESSLTITSVGESDIVLSDGNTYNRNSSGDQTTTQTIGQVYPESIAYVTDSKELRCGTTTVSNLDTTWGKISGDIEDQSDLSAALSGKQDTISDLATIRSGATLGATALQSYTESDPTVPSYVKSITEANITSWNNKSDFSGSYEDLTNKPTIPTKTSELTNDSNYVTSDYHDTTKQDVISDLDTIRTNATAVNTKQDTLVSGTNIKTINSESILGSGNITISVDTALQTMLSTLYPVGSVYISVNSTCPLSTLISGSEWTNIGTKILTDASAATSVSVKGNGKSFVLTDGSNYNTFSVYSYLQASTTTTSVPVGTTVTRSGSVATNDAWGVTTDANNSGLVADTSNILSKSSITVNIFKRTA